MPTDQTKHPDPDFIIKPFLYQPDGNEFCIGTIPGVDNPKPGLFSRDQDGRWVWQFTVEVGPTVGVLAQTDAGDDHAVRLLRYWAMEAVKHLDRCVLNDDRAVCALALRLGLGMQIPDDMQEAARTTFNARVKQNYDADRAVGDPDAGIGGVSSQSTVMCECGCGEECPVSFNTDTGERVCFIQGHSDRTSGGISLSHPEKLAVKQEVAASCGWTEYGEPVGQGSEKVGVAVSVARRVFIWSPTFRDVVRAWLAEDMDVAANDPEAGIGGVVFILAKDEMFLMEERDDIGDWRRQFFFPAGKREPGEVLDTTLAREMKEELKVELDQVMVMQLRDRPVGLDVTPDQYQLRPYLIPTWHPVDGGHDQVPATTDKGNTLDWVTWERAADSPVQVVRDMAREAARLMGWS